MSTGPVPPQPVIVDGDLALRPWADDDPEPARLLHDEQISHWFGFPVVIPPDDDQLRALRDWHAAYADGRRVVSFVIESRGLLAGTVEVRQVAEGVGALSWAVFEAFRGRGVASRAVRLLARFAFDELGLTRVEAYVERENRASLRTAMRAGLRREGVLRGHGAVDGRRRDVIVVGRLADDPEPTTPEGFRGLLNAGLNRTRVIAQALIRDEAGRVLLCELTYKRFWDLPGGVVDPFESPAEAVAREVGEEVGVDLAVGALKVVSWLPPWQGWDDACLFVFEASVPAGSFDGARLEEREIAALHWCGLDDLDAHVADYTARLIRAAVAADGPVYLEDGLPRA